MSFANDKLPLDYPPKKILRIYRDRLLVFGGVIIGNFVLLALVMFAIAQPVVFSLVIFFAGLFIFAFLWASIDAVLNRAKKKFTKTKTDLARDTEEITGVIMAYRKRQGGDTWHWCRNCGTWPTSGYTERPTKPSSGELCNECMAKQKAGTCRS